MQLIQYVLDDGQIRAVYDTEVPTLLAAQMVPGDTTYGYLEALAPIVSMEQDHYEVLEGVVHAKREMTIAASPSPFAADGLSVCQMTVTPFAPCILVINGQEMVLTASDPTVVLTADSPMVFQIVLKLMPSYWATPITVEAI